MSIRTYISILVVSFALPAGLKAQSGGVVRAVRIERPLTVDGQLSEAEWSQAQVVALPYEIEPRENASAPQRTEVRLLYSSEMLYVGFVCRDSSMESSRAAYADRDKATPDDLAVFVLDTYGDHQRAYIFSVNPRGVQGDAMFSGNREDASFDLVWRSAVRRFSDGWSVEMGIPFASLRFPDRKEQRWLVLFGRQYPRATMAMLSATRYDRDNPCITCQGMTLLGVEGVRPGSAFDVLPYVGVSQRDGLRDEDDLDSPFDRGKTTPRAGIGLKYAPTPNLILEGVLNPDFSQIESDAVQISVNSNFALYYPEKRPFFLEGADLYQSIFSQWGDPTFQVFYSRTINDPLAAGKVFGKSGALSFGVIAAQDRNTSIIVPGEEESDVAETGRESQSGVARVRYEFGNESFIGGFGSVRMFGADASHLLGGIDGRWRFSNVYSLTAGAYISETKELNDLGLFDEMRTFGATRFTAAYDGERFRGAAGRLELSRQARDYGFALTAEAVQPTFQSQNGFMGATNRNTFTGAHSYTFYPEGSIIDRLTVFNFAGTVLNDRRLMKERYVGAGIGGVMKGQTQFTILGQALGEERYGGVLFRHLPMLMANISSTPFAALTLKFNLQYGRFVYRDGTPPEAGDGHALDLEVLVRLTDRFRWRVNLSRARLMALDRRELFYDGNVYQSLAVYQFTPEFSLRLIGQFDTFDRVASLYPLIAYRLNAFSAVYLGATQGTADYGASRGGWRSTSRQFFAKVQYLIQG
ncbi:MAG: carbohydrate binding family 9 domain-containing protein [Bacteroidetes bacterium]|jgi:hypothetical protein|nr:carbohydrate binding family 9 domain-containing protein [Bacteroidota bacterium]